MPMPPCVRATAAVFAFKPLGAPPLADALAATRAAAAVVAGSARSGAAAFGGDAAGHAADSR